MMNTDGILNIFTTMVNENIIYAFHGEFNYHMVDTLLNDIKKEIHNSELEVLTQKKTYKILVECLENVHKHTTEKEKNTGVKHEGIFVLTRKDNGYGVIVGNTILEEEKPDLEKKLIEVNSSDRDELKKKYKEQMRNGSISDKGGAGLGIIDIALKSGSKLNYDFHKHTDNKIFFTLEIQIIE